MKRGKNSQLLPVIIIVVVVIISVALIVTLVRTFILGNGSSNQQQQQNSDEAALLNTAIDRGVQMTIRGEITADEKFRSYRITITPNSRVMTTYAGYKR
jgi:flagellar basal body-associated protein FliL